MNQLQSTLVGVDPPQPKLQPSQSTKGCVYSKAAKACNHSKLNCLWRVQDMDA